MKASPLLLLAIISISSAGAFSQRGAGTALIEYHATAQKEVEFGAFVRPRAAIEAPAKPLSPSIEAERQTFALLNAERAGRGLPPLQWSDTVAAVARLHSDSMAKHDFFSHTGLDGLTVDVRADRNGLDGWTAIGENIAFVRGIQNPSQFAIEQWMQSNSHRENMLATRWNESAIGVSITPDGRYYFTQVFITRN